MVTAETSDGARSRPGTTGIHHVASDLGQASLHIFGQVLLLLSLTGSLAAALRNPPSPYPKGTILSQV